jgi:hypothetical protein
MIVEPTPTSPRSPWRRALRLAGIVLPVALLTGIVGAGLLGPKVEGPAARSPRVAEATSGPSTKASGVASATGSEPAASGSPEASDAVPAFPTQFGDLPAAAPSEVRAARQAGGDLAALAVAGVLDIGPGPGCDDLPDGPLGPWCARSGIIYDDAAPTSGDGATFRQHLHVMVPVGVRLPDAVVAAAEDGTPPVRVLVVGRFATVGCAGRCDDGFVVERVAWAAGRQVGITPLLAAPLATGTKRPNPFALALDAADLPLMAVLVWPDGVRDLDPAAARFALAGTPSEPVWYVRALDGARGPGMERHVRWVLLAEKDLHVIASGRPASQAQGAITNVPAVVSPGAATSPASSASSSPPAQSTATPPAASPPPG